MCFNFFKKMITTSDNGTQNNNSGKTINSFEIITLHLSGMRLTCEYEIVNCDEAAEISYYEFRYGSGEERRELIKTVNCDIKTVLQKLNEYKLMSWDGFHGKHPKGVLDGTMFTLKAVVNGDKKIYADGSENFPKHFRDFERWLCELIR